MVPIPVGGFYPAVGLRSEGEEVRLDLNARWTEQTTLDGCEEKLSDLMLENLSTEVK